MLFQSGGLFGGRVSLWVAVCLIPATIVLGLLYTAEVEEEDMHGRNLRWLAQMATQINDRVQNYSNFVRDRAKANPAGVKAGPLPSGANRQPPANPYSIENLRPPANVVACDPEHWVHLSVVDEGQERQLRFFRSSGKRNECAQSDLSKLVEPAIRKDAFTSVVLAQRNGRVLYQSGPESLRIMDVSFLFAGNGEGRSKAPSTKAGNTPDDAPARGGTPTSSVHLTSLIGDATFAVFVQPLPIMLRAEKGPADSDWILIGLSEKQNLLGSSSPNEMMLFLPFAVLLVVMIWPLQRLWSMSPFEPWRRRDVVLTIVCSLGVTVIISLQGVSEYSTLLSRARTDEQLRSFAEELGSHFKAELTLAVHQLRTLDAIVTKGASQSHASILEHVLQPDQVHLPFEYADWIDGKGEKTIRWTPKATPPQLVNVSDRSYFKDVLSDSTLDLPDISPAKFAIEQVLSRTSGQAVTMVSIRSAPKNRQDIRVASIAVNLVSLSDPIAPRDLGFAIIDPSGKVLFHSERSRMFVENLFDECRKSKELRGVVSRRIPAYVELEYAASPHKMFVTPVKGVERLPWTLVAFRKLSANRIGRMQVLADTFALLCAYGVGLALAVALAFPLLTGHTFQPRRTSLVRWWTAFEPGRPYVAGAGFVLLIVVWRAFGRFHGWDLLYASIGSALSFVLMTTLGLRYPAGERCLRELAAAQAGESVTIGRRKLGVRARPRLFRLAGLSAVLTVLSLCLQDWLMACAAPVAVLTSGFLVSRVFGAVPREQHPLVLRAAWLVWGVELALAVCILPTLMLSRLSYEYESGLRLRDSQWRLWNADAQRRHEVARAVDETPGVDKHEDIRKRLLAAIRVSDPNQSTPPLYYYGTATSRISLFQAQGDKTPVEENRCAPDTPGDSDSPVQLASALPRLILAGIELPNEDRLLGFDARQRALEPASNLWTWHQHGRYLCLCSDKVVRARAELPVFDPFRTGEVAVHASSGPSPGTGQLLSALPAWIGLIALLAALALWMEVLRRRMRLIDAQGTDSSADPPYDGTTPPSARQFLLAPTAGARGELPQSLRSFQRIDVSRGEFSLDAIRQSLPENGLLLDHFEARFNDPEVRTARLQALEAALLSEGGPVVIVSAIDCVRYLTGGDAGDPGAVADDSELKRWCTLMNHFERRALPPGPSSAVSYAAIWDTCSEREKHVLIETCRHGLVNPRAGHIVQGLLQRGLIRRTGDLRLRVFSAGFRAFVVAATALRPKISRPRSGAGLPAYAIGLVFLGFVLFVSQEEVTTRLIGFLTTVMGGFETFRKQLAGLQGDSGGAKKA